MTAYEMRISDWSSDVCSSELPMGPNLVDRRLIEHLDHRARIAAIGSPSDIFLEGSEIIPVFENHHLMWCVVTSNYFDISEARIARCILHKHGQIAAKRL